jgi:hypothetical protein
VRNDSADKIKLPNAAHKGVAMETSFSFEGGLQRELCSSTSGSQFSNALLHDGNTFGGAQWAYPVITSVTRKVQVGATEVCTQRLRPRRSDLPVPKTTTTTPSALNRAEARKYGLTLF